MAQKPKTKAEIGMFFPVFLVLAGWAGDFSSDKMDAEL